MIAYPILVVVDYSQHALYRARALFWGHLGTLTLSDYRVYVPTLQKRIIETVLLLKDGCDLFSVFHGAFLSSISFLTVPNVAYPNAFATGKYADTP
jgi:hypothetical protein